MSVSWLRSATYVGQGPHFFDYTCMSISTVSYVFGPFLNNQKKFYSQDYWSNLATIAQNNNFVKYISVLVFPQIFSWRGKEKPISVLPCRVDTGNHKGRCQKNFWDQMLIDRFPITHKIMQMGGGLA